MKSSTLFHEEKIAEGVILAILLHAFFNIFLELGWTFVMVPYLFIGYAVLSHLFKKKEDHKDYEKILEARTSVRMDIER